MSLTLSGVWGSRAFVKPVSSGSSYGITRVTEASELPAAIEEAFCFDTRVLVEAAVVGTEITVPVLGNEDVRALEAIEVRYDTDFYDLSVKYDDPSKHHVIPPELPADVVERAKELACMHTVRSGARERLEATSWLMRTACPTSSRRTSFRV